MGLVPFLNEMVPMVPESFPLSPSNTQKRGREHTAQCGHIEAKRRGLRVKPTLLAP